jgi:hypothetical protein
MCLPTTSIKNDSCVLCDWQVLYTSQITIDDKLYRKSNTAVYSDLLVTYVYVLFDIKRRLSSQKCSE